MPQKSGAYAPLSAFFELPIRLAEQLEHRLVGLLRGRENGLCEALLNLKCGRLRAHLRHICSGEVVGRVIQQADDRHVKVAPVLDRVLELTNLRHTELDGCLCGRQFIDGGL